MVPQVAKLLRKERLPDAALCKPARDVLAGTLGAGEADLGAGLYKKRLARPGGGKSSGYRAIIAYRSPRADRVLVVYAFAKNAASTLTPQGHEALSQVAQAFVAANDEQLAELLASRDVPRWRVMATTKARPAKHMGVRAVEEDVLAAAHSLAAALHRVGALDIVGMHDMDRLCPPPRPDYDGPEIKRIRAATRMSQPVFARLLGVDKSAVAQWERGVKRPSGPALRLLEVLDPDKPESPVVQVRRRIEKAA